MRRESARRETQEGPPAAVAASAAEPRAPSAPASVDAENLELLDTEARYHRDRLALYRARVYAGKPTSAARLRELERTAAAADARLAHAHRRRKRRPPLPHAESVTGDPLSETSDEP